jgi:hypothetical protein
MEKLTPHALSAYVTPEEKALWETTLAAGVIAQSLAGGVAVGGTASAIYAGHRLSTDTDHLLMDLREHFDEVLERLSDSPEWKTARLKRPVLILGSIRNCEVGFRQSQRTLPIETVKAETPYGGLVIPTLDEMIGMKAYLLYQRNAVRDFLDFAALTECANEAEVIASLMKLDERYGELQTSSVRLEVSRTLTKPAPVDLEGTDLSHYKALADEWHDWSRTEMICRKFGLMLGEKIISE